MCHPQSSQIVEILFVKREELGTNFLAVCCSDKPNPICVLSGLDGSSTKFYSPNALLSKHLESTAYNGVKIISLFYNGLENVQGQLGSTQIP